MSYVIAAPEMMTSAATDLATIGSDLSAAHLASAAPTVSLIPAAADEVSAAVTKVFSAHAAEFQGLAAKASAFHDQFVQTLQTGGHAYAATEATATASLFPDKGFVVDHIQLLRAWAEIATEFSQLPIEIQSQIASLISSSIYEIASLIYNLPPWLFRQLPIVIQHWVDTVPGIGPAA